MLAFTSGGSMSGVFQAPFTPFTLGYNKSNWQDNKCGVNYKLFKAYQITLKQVSSFIDNLFSAINLIFAKTHQSVI